MKWFKRLWCSHIWLLAHTTRWRDVGGSDSGYFCKKCGELKRTYCLISWEKISIVRDNYFNIKENKND